MEDLDVRDREGYVEACFLGEFSVERFNRQADAASRACRDRSQPRLLVDLTRLENAHPSTLERYDLALHAVKASAGLKVALLTRSDFLDPAKFGIIVAQNRGLTVDAFLERPAALAWLLAGDAPPAAP